jgi:hypothetical protein
VNPLCLSEVLRRVFNFVPFRVREIIIYSLDLDQFELAGAHEDPEHSSKDFDRGCLVLGTNAQVKPRSIEIALRKFDDNSLFSTEWAITTNNYLAADFHLLSFRLADKYIITTLDSSRKAGWPEGQPAERLEVGRDDFGANSAKLARLGKFGEFGSFFGCEHVEQQHVAVAIEQSGFGGRL